jgi:hypothetical protein
MVYLIDNGVVEDKDYKYTATKNSCNLPQGAKKYKLDKYQYCSSCSDDQWWNLFMQGPVTIAVDASQMSSYRGGIMNFSSCPSLNHAVIAVGWSSDAEGDILTFRNSWNTWWGEQGYGRIRVGGSGNTCNGLMFAYLPVVKSNPPPPPPPPACFNVTPAFNYNDKWNLKKPFSGIINFNATGTDFNLVTMSSINGFYASTITFLKDNSAIIVSNGDNSIVCYFNVYITKSVSYRYSVTYSTKNGSIVISVNDVKFTCAQNINPGLTSVVAFQNVYGYNDVPANICNVSTTAN